MSARQQWLIDNLLPTMAPTDTADILEIGFGAGEHLIELAITNPNKIIIGAEPFINGVASLLAKITDTNNNVLPEYKNIRIFPDDVRNLISRIKCRVSQIYILHPDPWPKARHEKRRLLNSDFLKTLSSFISKDGKILIGTDHTDYYEWILDQASKTNLIVEQSKIDAIKTRYQEKNMFGSSKTMYLTLRLPQT